MQNQTNNLPNEPEQRKKRGLIPTLLAILIVLIIIIIILLLRSCGNGGETGGESVLEPEYPTISVDPGAEPIENEPSEEAAEVSQGGGSVTLSFKDSITYSLSTGKLSLYYQNPSASTHNVVVQVILVRGEDEYMLSQSGILKPGYQVTSLTADENAPQLSQGGYEGKIRLRFYDPETGERAIVDTDIPCTVTVTE